MEVLQEGWEDVTVAEYLELLQIQKESKSMFKRQLETLCYLTDSDEWEEMSVSEVVNEFMKHKWLSQPPLTTTIPETLGIYLRKPFSKLSLSEWIDMDSSIVDGNIAKVAAVVYRQHKTDEWGNLEDEPYKFSLADRSIKFEDYPCTTTIGIFNEAVKYREELLKNFSEIFGSFEDETLDDTERSMLSEQEILNIEKTLKEDNVKKHYSWQKILDDSSSGNWSSIPAILDLPHVFFFNMRVAQKVYS